MKNITVPLILCFVPLIYAQVNPGNYTIDDLEVNTEWSEFGTTYWGKDTLVFAAPRDRIFITRFDWPGNNQPYLDLYMGQIDENGEIINKKPIPGDVNRKFHEAAVAFTKDKKTVYFSGNNYQKVKSKNGKKENNIQLYKAKVNEEGIWEDIKRLPFNSTGFSTGLPSLNRDDTKLYFVSDRPGGVGKTDIYVVDIKPKGTYGKPKNLGKAINTPEKEMFPFISDENILYYSSNGNSEDPDLDVYASKIYLDSITKPVSLGVPINSAGDDYAFVIDVDKQKGFFSSNREEGAGDDDIYRFEAVTPISFECSQWVEVYVKNEETGETLKNAFLMVLDENGEELQRPVPNKDGLFSYEAPCDTRLTLVANADGYLKKQENIKTEDKLNAPTMRVNITLTPEFIKQDEKILVNIETIYFDYNKWNIRPDAALELDKVVTVMNTYPDILIESGSHTDSRGRSVYNQGLSEKRARATKEYIISRGIDPRRITARGYGETDLVNDCYDGVRCAEEQHEANRRTEFKVTSAINTLMVRQWDSHQN